MEVKIQYRAIVIGASAGGLHALSFIFEKLPVNYPIPIIVVQHRSKDQPNLLEEVLQSKCKITIKQVDEKEKIISGTVYIAPPDYHLLVEENETFSLSFDERVSYSRPSIDVLFESAAQAYGDTLVGIILTGANSDGASGISAIKRHKGLTVALSPKEAEYPIMPMAAIATKNVLKVLTLAEIQNFLLKQIAHE